MTKYGKVLAIRASKVKVENIFKQIHCNYSQVDKLQNYTNNILKNI